LIEAVEKIFQRTEEANDEATGAERRQVDRDVCLPELFAKRETEKAGREDGDVAMKSEERAIGMSDDG